MNRRSPFQPCGAQTVHVPVAEIRIDVEGERHERQL